VTVLFIPLGRRCLFIPILGTSPLLIKTVQYYNVSRPVCTKFNLKLYMLDVVYTIEGGVAKLELS